MKVQKEELIKNLYFMIRKILVLIFLNKTGPEPQWVNKASKKESNPALCITYYLIFGTDLDPQEINV
jgi:hypothetical protein